MRKVIIFLSFAFLVCKIDLTKEESKESIIKEEIKDNTYMSFYFLGDDTLRAMGVSSDPRKIVRVFSVSHKISLLNLEDEEIYKNSYRKYMEMIKPYISKRYKNIVSFEEHTSLNLLFFGEKGATARTSKSTTEAFLKLIGSTSSAQNYYRRKFPDVATFQARLVFLALTDTLWRVFFNTFSSLAKEYGVYIVSCQNISEIEKKSWDNTAEILVDGSIKDRAYYFVATTSDVWNTCFVFSPTGEIIHKTKKVNLVPTEKFQLQFSEGKYEWLQVLRIPDTEIDICIGISLDAFVPQYVKTLDEKGCDLFIQPDANGGWFGKGGQGYWQPDEWTDSTFGVIQRQYYIGCTAPQIYIYFENITCPRSKIPGYKNIRYNVNPMMVGNIFEFHFDGQNAITGRGGEPGKGVSTPPQVLGDENYICLPAQYSRYFRERYPDGYFILLAPWSGAIEEAYKGKISYVKSPVESDQMFTSCVKAMKERDEKLKKEGNYIESILGTDLLFF